MIRSTNAMVKVVSKTEALDRKAIQSRLRICVTDGCNFHCFFCHNEGQGPLTSLPSKMSVGDIRTVVELAYECGIKRIKLTGGEPLLYRYGGQGIVELVQEVADVGVGDETFDLSLTTNGLLLSQYASRLKQAGLGRVTVSLPTLNIQIMQKYIKRGARPDDIRNVLEGIKTAIRVGLNPVKVNMVLFYSVQKNEGNVFEMREIMEKCKELGVSELRFYTLLWHKDFEQFEEYYQHWDSKIFDSIELPENCAYHTTTGKVLIPELRTFSKVWAPFMYPRTRIVFHYESLPIAFEPMRFGRFIEWSNCKDCPYKGMCQEGSYSLRVSANGKITGCLLNPKCVNIKALIQTGASRAELLNAFRSAFELLPGNRGAV